MHGGDIYNNKVDIDFSISLSPLGICENIKKVIAESINNLDCYPDIECGQLRKALSVHHGVSADNILCSNGASESLLAICHAFKPKRTLLLAPGFTGYEYVLKSTKTNITYHELKERNGFIPDGSLIEQLKTVKPDIMFVTNPNNPTGRLVDFSLLNELISVAKSVDTFVVVDECFLELAYGNNKKSVIKMVNTYDNLIVVRAFTKSFAVAGLRLGYLVSCVKNINKIKKHLPEWNVSTMAQAAGIAALQDENYLPRALEYIKNEREYLSKGLKESGFKVYSSDCNFILFFDENNALFQRMLSNKILIRDCSDFVGLCEGYYRIAVRTHEENKRLIQAVRKGVYDE